MRFKYSWLIFILPLFFLIPAGSAISASTGIRKSDFLPTGRQHKVISGGLENILWKFKTKGKISAPPLVHNKTLFLGSEDGIFNAINIEDGAIIWSIKLKRPIKCSPAAANGLIVIGDGLYVYAIYADTGIFKWKFKVRATITSGVSISGSKVLFGSNKSKFYALDLNTGKKLWVFNAPIINVYSSLSPYQNDYSSFSPPVIYEDRVCFTSFVEFSGRAENTDYAYSNINCIKIATGKLIWKESRNILIIHAPPVVEKGKIYAGSTDGHLFAFSALIGEQKWDYNLLETIRALSLYNGTVYSSTVDGYIFAFDAGTGKVRWRYFAGEPISSFFTVTEKAILFGTGDGLLHAIDRKRGKYLWGFQAGGIVRFSPLILEDRLILVMDDAIICFSGRGKKVASQRVGVPAEKTLL